MEEDKRIDWETFVKSQLHWIRVVYKIVGSQENLQEIYNLYEEFADKKRPAMEDDEEPGWEGNFSSRHRLWRLQSLWQHSSL